MSLLANQSLERTAVLEGFGVPGPVLTSWSLFTIRTMRLELSGLEWAAIIRAACK